VWQIEDAGLKALRYTTSVRLESRRPGFVTLLNVEEGLVEVGNDVFDVFDAYGEAD
jgi:hypothetical protein